MNLTFYGAAREVTGSMFLLTTDSDKILLDCGLFQGRRQESFQKNRILPFDPAILSNVVLSHAHIDHSGRLPVLTERGFGGRIFCTRATAAACEYLLPDAGKIQESDAEYLNYKTARRSLAGQRKSRKARAIGARAMAEIKRELKKGAHTLDAQVISRVLRENDLQAVEPLYTQQEAERSLKAFEGRPYEDPVTIGKDTTLTLYEAGHILGSAMCLVTVRRGGETKRILHSGDIGRFNAPILKDPTTNFREKDRAIDLLLMESTYGDRDHEVFEKLKPRLEAVLRETFKRRGQVIIPAFAFGRTQTLLYVLHELFNEKRIPQVPVHVDSPLAVKLTRVFGEHPEVYDEQSHDTFLEQGENPFQFPGLQLVSSVEESMELNRMKGPRIILSASGMCEAGRILHHLRYKIHDERNTVLLVGYMAANTLGRRLEEMGLDYEQGGRRGPAPVMRFMGKEYPLKARVEKIGGFSAHADRGELLRFLKESNLRIKRIALVHGEEEQALPFQKTLEREGFQVSVPRRGEQQVV